MTPTVYQDPQLFDGNGTLIRNGAFGPETPFCNETGTGVYDYLANDLEALKNMSIGAVIQVETLPESGVVGKAYVVTTGVNAGKEFMWSGSAWVELTSQMGDIITAAQTATTKASEASASATNASKAEADAENFAVAVDEFTKETGSDHTTTYRSAKYYADSASADATIASTAATSMTTHLAQIDQNTGGVSANSKRISNIEKLLQGTMYDYDTDDDVAYTKSVPAGAMPYAGIEKVGGKTLVMNQFVQNGNFADTSVWYEQNSATFSVSNNVATVSATASVDSGIAQVVSMIANHKYFKAVDIVSNFAIKFDVGSRLLSTSSGSGIRERLTQIAEWTTTSGNYTLRIRRNSAGEEAGTFTVANVIVIDLTLLFGAGNEPTTVAEFEAMFPADYYAYNAGTLLSAGVTSVVSNVNKINTTTLEQGSINVNNGADASATNRVRTGYMEVKPNTTYNLRVSGTPVIFNWHLYNSSKTQVGVNDTSNSRNYNLTTTANTAYMRLTYRYTDNSTITANDIVGASVSLATPLQTYSIPAAVQALTGYGWSAGNVYNYVDFERKVFVQNVARVDLGSLSWNGGTNNHFYATLSTPYPWANNVGMICQKYVFDGYGSTSNTTDPHYYYGGDKTFRYFYNQNSAHVSEIYISDSSYDDTTAFKTAMNGVYLYYELANPIETDISAYLTDDNLIQVESGGTLTFPNSNGADYQIPVPSEEEYMIDIQSALS